MILFVGTQKEDRFTPCPANSALRFWQHLGKRAEMELVCSLVWETSPFYWLNGLIKIIATALIS